MSMVLTVTVVGENKPAKRLRDKGRRAGDMTPAYLKTFEYLEGVEKRQFNSQGVQSGDPWEALAEATVARKASMGQDPRILHADEVMRESLTEKGPGSIRIATPHRAVFGTSVPYAAIHQEPRPGNPLPQRKPIDLTESQRRSANFISIHYVSNGVAKLPYAK